MILTVTKNHAEGVYIINAKHCISSKQKALYIIIAKAEYSLQLMIYTFGGEIHAVGVYKICNLSQHHLWRK